MKKNKFKYKVIKIDQITDNNKNDIGFIAPDGTFYYLRKYKKGGAQNTKMADLLLKELGNPCSDVNKSCERLCRKYNFLCVIDDYGDGKVSIVYYNEPSKAQWEVINMLYEDYVLINERNGKLIERQMY